MSMANVQLYWANGLPIIGDHTDVDFDPLIGGERKARGAVPRDHSIQPARGAVQIDTIPLSEWPERIRDQKAAKARLSDIRDRGANGQQIPSYDQNGQGYSHDGDTEVLTEKGWVPWCDWNHTDLLATVNPLTHLMEFQAATEWHASEYRGEMYHSTNRRLDFGVTNYHRMYVRKWDERKRTLSDRYSFQLARDLGWYVGLMPAPGGFLGTELIELAPAGCDRTFDGDDFLALLALIVSDGYAGGSEKGRHVVSFCCFDERYSRVAALAARVGFKEQPGRKGVWNLGNAALAAWVRRNCYTTTGLGAANKRVPDVVKVASSRQIGLFLGWFGDLSKGDSGIQLWTASKRLADDLQELYLRVGKRTHIGLRPAKTVPFAGSASGEIRGGPCYTLTVGDTDRLCIDRKKHIETDGYRGLVYCATVPNGLLITRRNGSVLISGNCWGYSVTAAMTLARAAADLPYVRLSAHSVASKVKSFRDEGGWCGLAMEFIQKNGVVPESHWPAKSRDRGLDNAANWAEAKKYVAQEGWVDLDVAVYDRNLTPQQVGTFMLTAVPGAFDFNHWSHSVAWLDVIEGATLRDEVRGLDGKLVDLATFDLVMGMNDPRMAGYVFSLWNSWTDSYGTNGVGILSGSKAVPDGAVALVTPVA